jgi:hypothetical protein
LHDFQKISTYLCWQQYIFRILSHQDDNTKVKQCRVRQNNLLPKAISLRHLFLSVESTAEHLIQSSLLFPQMARRAKDTHRQGAGRSDSIFPSNVTSSAERHQNAYHLGCFSPLQNHSSNPDLHVHGFQAASLCFPITPAMQHQSLFLKMYWLFGPTSNILYSQLLLGRPDP